MARVERLKPASSVRTRLGLAAATWSAVGAGLFAAGLIWSNEARGPLTSVLLVLALGVGWLKARFVLEPRAAANARRIAAAGDGRCLGGFFSWGSWAFVAGMIVLGAALRRSTLPRTWLGALYVAVGAALLVASRAAWMEWWRRSDGGS